MLKITLKINKNSLAHDRESPPLESLRLSRGSTRIIFRPLGTESILTAPIPAYHPKKAGCTPASR